jgi:hypothetical protein
VEEQPPVDWPSSLVEAVDRLLLEPSSTPPPSRRRDHLESSLFLTMDQQPLWTFRNLTITIYAEDPGTTRDIEDLNIVIVGPHGQHQPIIQYTLLSDRIICTFRPLVPGAYTINAFYRYLYLIVGCPILVNVSRQYQPSPRSIVTMDLSSLDSTWDADSSRKPWGIACNTSTEQVSTIIFFYYYYFCWWL